MLLVAEDAPPPPLAAAAAEAPLAVVAVVGAAAPCTASVDDEAEADGSSPSFAIASGCLFAVYTRLDELKSALAYLTRIAEAKLRASSLQRQSRQRSARTRCAHEAALSLRSPPVVSGGGCNRRQQTRARSLALTHSRRVAAVYQANRRDVAVAAAVSGGLECETVERRTCKRRNIYRM